MNDKYTRITVPLSKDEFEALMQSAQAGYRHPRDQARYLLHSVLLSKQPTEMNNRQDALVCDGQSTKAVRA